MRNNSGSKPGGETTAADRTQESPVEKAKRIIGHPELLVSGAEFRQLLLGLLTEIDAAQQRTDEALSWLPHGVQDEVRRSFYSRRES